MEQFTACYWFVAGHSLGGVAASSSPSVTRASLPD
jgi:hypothetical protein